MPDKSGLNVSTILVAVPIVHIIVVSVYLFFYCAGFGANISVFVKPEDIFSISMQSIVRIYITSLIFPAVFTWFRYASGTPFASTAIARLEGEERVSAERKNNFIKKSLVLFAISMVAIAAFGYLWNFYNGRYVGYFMGWQCLSMFYYVVVYKYKEKMGFDDFWHECFVVGSVFLISSITLGLDSGYMDRVSKYQYDITTNSRCDDGAVLHKLGEMYLSTMPNESKVFLSLDCKPVIFVPNLPLKHLQ